ncbi:LysR family transcriptional regulator [Kribbella sp. NBC_00382]
MELRHVEYFVAVAEELSFTRAAARLSMAQSPISQQILKLERELGVALFERSTRSVQLTPAGCLFYEEAVALLAAANRMADNARLAGQGRLGRLSLAFTGSATYDLMPQLVSAYAQRYPGVLLEVRSEMLTPAQVAALLDGTVSVGLLRPPVTAEGLVVEVLRDEPLVVLLPISHPLASRVNLNLADLAGESFISYPSSPPSSVFRTVQAACRQAGFTPKVRQEAAETSSLVALVAAGLGIALAPASVRHLRINGVTHRPIIGTDVTLSLAIAYKSGPVPPLVRGYLETARAVVRKQKPASSGPLFDDQRDLPDSV